VEWVIEVEGLVKEFNGRRVLHDVTFHEGRGKVFRLLDPKVLVRLLPLGFFLDY